jgi:hypothetical protein
MTRPLADRLNPPPRPAAPRANRERKARDRGEAIEPRPATLRAIEEISTFKTVADMLASDHASSGPRWWDRKACAE